MSGAMENRAAVFTSSSQDVEVYQAGAWWSGSLLGWRHEADGSCQVWVRAVVAGVERTSWTELGAVRLPEPPSLQPALTVSAPGGSAFTSTIGLVPVRDGASGAAGTAAPDRRSGGRRRAPETDGPPGWAAVAQARSGAASAHAPASPGRHRAPVTADSAAAGRHRAADTGVLPPVRDEGAPRATRRRPAPGAVHRAETGWVATAESSGRTVPVVPEMAGAPDDGEFHTRPLRLATSVPQPRAPH